MNKKELYKQARRTLLLAKREEFSKYFTDDFTLSGSEVWFCTPNDEMTGLFAVEHYSRVCRNDYLTFDVKTELLEQIEEGDCLVTSFVWSGTPRPNYLEIAGGMPGIFVEGANPTFKIVIITHFRGDKICKEMSVHNTIQTEIAFCNGDKKATIDKLTHVFDVFEVANERFKSGEQFIPDPSEKIRDFKINISEGDFAWK